MIPSYWYSPVGAFLWQVVLHSLVAAGVLHTWSRHLHLPSGSSKRWLLCTSLILPIITALIPGRNNFTFRERLAWVDSIRFLSIPLSEEIRVWHLVLVVAILATLASIWQEVLPALRRSRPDVDGAPEDFVRRARALPLWERCRVEIARDEAIFLATAGRPSRPRLIVSTGALRELTDEELEVVLLHENAHWRRGRWVLHHFLFLLRILQCYNPVALWTFREYLIESEIDCDRDAVFGRDPKMLARALLKVYESTDLRDFSARSALRQRVDILLGRSEPAGEHLSPGSVAVAASILLFLLPWLV